VEITGRYDDFGAELEGRADALRDLAEALRGAGATEERPLRIPTAPASPFLGYIQSLKITQTNDHVVVSRLGSQLIISGSPHGLEVLASVVDHVSDQDPIEARGPSAYHIHIEYYPGHAYLKQGSLPLVVQKSA
jgi:hypothetical protein